MTLEPADHGDVFQSQYLGQEDFRQNLDARTARMDHAQHDHGAAARCNTLTLASVERDQLGR